MRTRKSKHNDNTYSQVSASAAGERSDYDHSLAKPGEPYLAT